MEPQGTIAFSTVGIPFYGFDVFSVQLPTTVDIPGAFELTELCHTDGVSANFNAQFVDEGDAVTFVSERTGSSRLYRTEPHYPKPEPLLTSSPSLFHDRPTLNNGRLVFVSAHEPHSEWFKSWSAVYSTELAIGTTVRLTPKGFADFSPAVSRSGSRIAVASYGSRKWEGDFREIDTEVAVFERSDPDARTVVSSNGGWPAWSGDSAVYFHRKSDDGWWSVFRSDLDGGEPRRVTPAGVHAFTPAASHDGRLIAVATRRKGSKFRHVELFDLETGSFVPVTARLNPDSHHYNPFFSPESGRLGYHRSRKESDAGEKVVHHFRPVESPVETLTMLRFPTTFPSFSPAGDYFAVNGDFFASPGMMIVRSDGSKRWTLLEEPSAFFTAWSPTEAGVIYTSVGPIFESSAATVHIARVSFDPADLDCRDAITASVKLLTRAVGNNAFPSCSPDGRSLVFRSGRSGFKNLYILDAVNGETDGGDGIRRLTEGEWTDTMPSWSPDGEHIAFSSNRHDPENPTGFSIYLVRPDGSGLRRVHVAGAEGSEDVDRERINHVCFSPDSEWLLFTANFGSVVAEPISLPNHYQPYGDLYVCRVDGTGLRRLTCNAYENGTPVWGSGSDVGLLNLGADGAGEMLIGRYEEPLWLTCDV
ncbi:uncharacterized protein M6B38_128020 [Iris pallida]|uniref:Uncharacterized protein n=1 Tax=Iris pallida TaxID=29817 RepID=A0AAX6G5D3_IRIPA|nr:uncharacterized protein M6B38_128020 [Iris pallida]